MLVEEFVADHPIPQTKGYGRGPEYGVRRAWGQVGTAAKLARIIFPRLELREATCEEAFGWFSRKSGEWDTTELDERKKGVVVTLEASVAADVRRCLTLKLNNLPAIEVLKYLTSVARLDFQLNEDGSISVNRPAPGPRCRKRIYRVPAIARDLRAGTILGPDDVKYTSVQELFATFGVEFPAGASAGFSVDGEIVVSNTDRNLAITDVVVAAVIDARGKKLSRGELDALRTIIADAQANGEIRNPTFLSIGEG